MSKLIKYTVEHYKKAGVSDADFVKWFNDVQVANGLPLIKKHGIVKYAVHFRDAQLSTAFRAELDKVRPEWEVSGADLTIEYYLPDIYLIQNLLADPEWESKAAKDQANFVDLSKSTIHIGYETIYLENGNILN
ncbi:hypothetical protein Daesc_009433 [Daldinia eschscholtzii]|uniref:EthD domain-containing protein n=1 Tax=Daldinia eschscholtzii TaxID=292717 RepID=A0AAX6M9K4_9PEZI